MHSVAGDGVVLAWVRDELAAAHHQSTQPLAQGLLVLRERLGLPIP